jgi:2-amino-4-hydroxy-6-hydroxymethyldihydropteridine diphosphokinase
VTLAALSIGSNIGDRFATLEDAVARIAAADGIDVRAVSSVYETDPVGGPEQGAYLNAVVVVDTDLKPQALFDVVQSIEQRHGRIREVRWGPRTLDIDVLAVDGVQSDDPALTLPHPRAHERAFVLVPWAEADPDFVVPGHGAVSDLVTVLPSNGVRRCAELTLWDPS